MVISRGARATEEKSESCCCCWGNWRLMIWETAELEEEAALSARRIWAALPQFLGPKL